MAVTTLLSPRIFVIQAMRILTRVWRIYFYVFGRGRALPRNDTPESRRIELLFSRPVAGLILQTRLPPLLERDHGAYFTITFLSRVCRLLTTGIFDHH
jgi:hypothetical protein